MGVFLSGPKANIVPNALTTLLLLSKSPGNAKEEELKEGFDLPLCYVEPCGTMSECGVSGFVRDNFVQLKFDMERFLQLSSGAAAKSLVII